MPTQNRTEPRSTMAFALSIAMHVAFVVVLFFAINWKTKSPAPVVAELWTPPPAATPRPAPKPEVKPAPPPPKPAPPPEPKVETKPPEKVDIALEQEKERKRLEEERKRLEALELKRRRDEEARKREEAEKKRKEEAARAEAEQKRKEEEVRAKAEREKKEREAAIAADKQLTADLEREMQERMARELAKAPAQAGRREGVPTSVPGDPNATAGYVDKIRAKIQGNVILPTTFAGNPEAEFHVQQLPTGEILSVKLTRSSGNKALDDAWERAILKSSPLPLPEQREIFQAALRLKFSPSDKR